jgi:GT2 family glycosyltransferase
MGGHPLVCFVNPDGDLTCECLDKLEQAMADPTVVACGPDIGSGMNPELLPTGDAPWIPGTCLVVRRSAFESVGGFDERLFMYHEDVDLGYKLRKLGRLVLVRDSHFSHDWREPSFVAGHRQERNWLIVKKRWEGDADPIRQLRNAAFSFRRGMWRNGLTRMTGTVDYLARGRHWV